MGAADIVMGLIVGGIAGFAACFVLCRGIIREAACPLCDKPIAASATSREANGVGKETVGLGPARTPDSGQSV